MRSRTHRRFWNEFNRLPGHVQCLARDKFRIWQRDPFHLSMEFKRLGKTFGRFESATTIALSRKDTAILQSGFWIATHEEYNKFVRQLR